MPSCLTRAAAPTNVPPRYSPDGNGRDLWRSRDIDKPPHTGTTFSVNKKSHSTNTGRSIDRCCTLPKFVPNGTGRDLFQQVNKDVLICQTGVTVFNSRLPIVTKRNKNTNFPGKPSPVYVPDGSGRDLYFSAHEIPLKSSSSSSLRLSKVSKAPRARTSPPPRFIPIGTGRDTFQNSSLLSPNSLRSTNSSKIEGFAYGAESISRSTTLRQRQVMNRYQSRNGSAVNLLQQLETSKRLSAPQPQGWTVAVTQPVLSNNLS